MRLSFSQVGPAQESLLAADKFRNAQDAIAQREPVGIVEPTPTINEKIAKLVDELVYQVDVASNVYFAYEGLCLFFSTPLVLFATPLLLRMKRSACRIPKLPFICAFVLAWWAYEYATVIAGNLHIELYLHNIQTDVKYWRADLTVMGSVRVRVRVRVRVCLCGYSNRLSDSA